MYKLELNIDEIFDLLRIVSTEVYDSKKYGYYTDEYQEKIDHLLEKIKTEIKKESQ